MGKPIRVGLIGLGRAGYGMHRIELEEDRTNSSLWRSVTKSKNAPKPSRMNSEAALTPEWRI